MIIDPVERPVTFGIIVALITLGFGALIVQMRIGDMDMQDMPGTGFTLGEPMAPDMLASKEASGAMSGLPVLSNGMPEFAGIATWLNGEPLAQSALRGKVVLVDFWTYSCINCIRTLPYITAWDQKYRDQGLVIVGVHTPEFAFEKVESNVRQAMERHGIAYPVALDNDYRTWRNYDNHYWPAKYLFDAQGRLRYAHFGEGEYDVTEANIQALLREAGLVEGPADGMVTFDPAVSFSQVRTPETYLGYERMELLGSPEPVRHDAAQTYSVAKEPAFNRFYLDGTWRVEGERAVLEGTRGSIVYRYEASAANLVMGAPAAPVRVEVLLDGAPVPVAMRGADVVEIDGRTYATIDAERLYSLIDARLRYGRHLLELRFEAPGVEAYAFTFG